MKKNHFYLLSILSLLLIIACTNNQDANPDTTETTEKKKRNVAGLGIQRGLVKSDDKAAPGYILFNPSNSASSYLMNRQGEIVHEWKGFYNSWLT